MAIEGLIAMWPGGARSLHSTDNSKWSARVVRVRELSAADAERWKGLCREEPSLAHPFFSYVFARAVDRVHPRAFVAVLKRDGQIVGFFPFQFDGALPMLLRAAERIGGSMSDRFGVIADNSFRMEPKKLLTLARLNSLQFSFLPDEQQHYGLSGTRTITGLHVVLSGDADTYWTSLKKASRKFASQVDRNERLLEQQLGPLRMTFRADPEIELPPLIELKRAQYRRTVADDPLAEHWTTDLFRELLQSADPQCTGVLSTLYAGNTWLASHMGVMSEAVLHYWFPVYNRDWSRYSPGHILTKHLLLSALGAGVRFFDMAGYGQYKDHFRPEPYLYQAGFWRTEGLGGLISQARSSLSWRIANLGRKYRQITESTSVDT